MLFFLPYLCHSKMITCILFFYCILNLLSFIVTMCWTEFLSRVLVYYIESHFYFVSIIGCHNCSYFVILNSILYLLYDSLSPSCALDINLMENEVRPSNFNLLSKI